MCKAVLLSLEFFPCHLRPGITFTGYCGNPFWLLDEAIPELLTPVLSVDNYFQYHRKFT